MSKEKILLFLLAAIQFTHIMDFMIIMPLGSMLMRTFEMGAGEFSILVSSYTFSAGVAGFVGAFFLDNYDRRKLILISYIGFIAGTVACAIAPDFYFFLLARVIAGLFGGVIAALILAVIGDAFPYERRGNAMGFVMAAFSFASVGGLPFGIYLADTISWHAPFIMLAIISVVILFFLLLFFPKMSGHVGEKKLRLKPTKILANIASDPNQMRGLAMMTMLILGQFTVLPFISSYMVANVGFTEKDLTFIYLIGGGATIFTGPLIGKLSDRWGKTRVFSWSVILSLIPILIITHLQTTALPLVLVITTFLFIVTGGRMIPAMAIITSAVKPSGRGSFMSISSSVQQLASGLSAVLTGLMVTTAPNGEILNFERAGYFAAVASIFAIIIATKVKVADKAPLPKTATE